MRIHFVTAGTEVHCPVVDLGLGSARQREEAAGPARRRRPQRIVVVVAAIERPDVRAVLEESHLVVAERDQRIVVGTAVARANDAGRVRAAACDPWPSQPLRGARNAR